MADMVKYDGADNVRAFGFGRMEKGHDKDVYKLYFAYE